MSLPTQSNRERGATALETIGIIVIAALVVTAIAGAVIHNGGKERIETALCQAISKITGSEINCGAAPGGNQRDPYKPSSCTVGSQGSSDGQTANVGVVDIKQEGGVSIKHVVKQDDGKFSHEYVVTATEDIGASTGADLSDLGKKKDGKGKDGAKEGDKEGEEGDDNKAEAGAKANAGAAIKAGSTWKTSSPEEAEKLAQQINNYREIADGGTGPVDRLSALADVVTNRTPPPPLPDTVDVSIGPNGDLSAEAGIPDLKFNGKLSAEDGWKGSYDRTTGLMTFSRTAKGNAQGGATAGDVSVSGGISQSVTQSITVDSHGNIKTYTETLTKEEPVNSSVSSKGKLPFLDPLLKHEETTTKTVEQTSTVDLQALRDSGISSAEYDQIKNTIYTSIASNAAQAGVAGAVATQFTAKNHWDLTKPTNGKDAVADMLQKYAAVSRSEYENKKTTDEASVKVDLKLRELGAGIKESSTTSTLKKHEVLSAPDAQGNRSFTTDEGCR